MSRATSRAWIVGCGDIGRRLARRLHAEGVSTLGWVRTPERAQSLRDAGIDTRALDLDAPIPSIHEAPDWLFWFAPPPPEGRVEPRLRHFLAALRRAPRRLVYLSTSAVYGDCGGRWIDEDEPLDPASDRGHRRRDGERAALEYAARVGCDALILRVPGIYGPGRLPRERLARGEPILRAEDAPFGNRIHAEDLADAAQVVAMHGAAGAAYHVADGHPTTMTDYFLRCAAHLGLPPPPQVSRAEARTRLSVAMRSFLEESRRLRIGRLCALGWAPRFPDLEAGLRACD